MWKIVRALLILSVSLTSCVEMEIPYTPSVLTTPTSSSTVTDVTTASPVEAIPIICDDLDHILARDAAARSTVTDKPQPPQKDWMGKIQYHYGEMLGGKTEMIAQMPEGTTLRLDNVLACIGVPELYEVAVYPGPDQTVYTAELWYVSRGIVLELDCPPSLLCPPRSDLVTQHTYTLTPDTGVWRLQVRNPVEASAESKKPYRKLRQWPGRIEDVRIVYDDMKP